MSPACAAVENRQRTDDKHYSIVGSLQQPTIARDYVQYVVMDVG